MTGRLYYFRMPEIPDWHPATVEDAAAIAADLVTYGDAYATATGRRVHPETVVIRNGHPYGGVVTTEDAPPRSPALSRLRESVYRRLGLRRPYAAPRASEHLPWPYVSTRSRRSGAYRLRRRR